MTETFYDVLGVSEDASTAEIESAYRESIKEVHPDVSDDVNASERTKRLNEAKRVLTDDDEREEYDRVGHEAHTGGGPTPSAPSDASGSESGRSGTSGDGTTTRASASKTGDGEAASSGGHGRRRSQSGSRRGRRRRRSGTSEDDAEWPGDVDWSGEADAGESDWAGASSSTGRRTDATGPSHASTGPSWQSSGTTRSGGGGGSGVTGPSARRQAAAGATDGPNVDWSWNGWETTRAWAVRQGDDAGRGIRPERIVADEQSTVLLASAFLLYPFFIATIVFPAFPLVARVTVAVCTLLMFAYLLSVPRVAVAVYGVWSVLVPVVVFLVPGLSLFSLVGIVGLSATWIPFGISALTLSVIRP